MLAAYQCCKAAGYDGPGPGLGRGWDVWGARLTLESTCQASAEILWGTELATTGAAMMDMQSGTRPELRLQGQSGGSCLTPSHMPSIAALHCTSRTRGLTPGDGGFAAGQAS